MSPSRKCLRFASAHLGRVVVSLVLLQVAPADGWCAEDGADLEQRAVELQERVQAFAATGDWEKVIPLQKEIVELLEKAFGPSAPNTDIARQSLADCLSTAGRYLEARVLYETCLQTRTNALSEIHAAVADTLLRLAETYRRTGSLTNAIAIYKRADDVLAKLPEESELRATCLLNTALVLDAQGRTRTAADRLQEAFGLIRNVDNPILKIRVLSSLGEVHRALGLVSLAVQEQEAALELAKDLPPRDPTRNILENNLASALRDQGRFADAVKKYETSIANLTQLLGDDELDVLTVRRNLALTYAQADDYAAALAVTEDILGRLRAMGATRHPIFPVLLTDRADQLQGLGDYVTSGEAFNEAEAAHRVSDAPGHPVAVDIRERRAVLATNRGDFAQASELLDGVLNYRRQAAGADPLFIPELVESLKESADFHRALGRHAKAAETLVEATALNAKAENGSLRLDLELTRGLADLADQQARFDESMRLYGRALEVGRRAYGDQSSAVALCHLAIAGVLLRQGQPGEAIRAVEVGKSILEAQNRQASGPYSYAAQLAAYAHLQQGAAERAIPMLEDALRYFERQDFVNAIAIGRDLALAELARGNTNRALELATQVAKRTEVRWQNVLRFGSELDRLAWQGERDTFSFLAQLAPVDPTPLATACLHLKGLVAASLAEDRQIARTADDPATRLLVRDLKRARRERYRAELSVTSAKPVAAETLARLRAEVERVESQLARHISVLSANSEAFSTTIESVTAALPEKTTVLLDFVEYQGPNVQADSRRRLGVLVMAKDRPVRWVDLGALTGRGQVAELLGTWHLWVRGVAPTNAATPPPGPEQLLRDLYQKLWIPIRPILPEGTRTVVVSPDSVLNFAPFALLFDGKAFLGESIGIYYVASARDLLRPPTELGSRPEIQIVADPAFSAELRESGPASSPETTLSALLKSLPLWGSGVSELPGPYAALPGALDEGHQLEAIAKSAGGFQTSLLTGPDAGERRIRTSGSPQILHLATHGTFLDGSEVGMQLAGPALRRQTRLIRNPLARAWLALAGANKTIADWRQGRSPAPESDGILTAEEIASLDLSQTWLVTLSACDTGVGEFRTGEGVFGMRRAFTLAGAQNLLMTLWPVDDLQTKAFMTAFYTHALKSRDARAAFQDVQRSRLRELREKEGVDRAARWAGGFALSGMGR